MLSKYFKLSHKACMHAYIHGYDCSHGNLSFRLSARSLFQTFWPCKARLGRCPLFRKTKFQEGVTSSPPPMRRPSFRVFFPSPLGFLQTFEPTCDCIMRYAASLQPRRVRWSLIPGFTPHHFLAWSCSHGYDLLLLNT